MSYKEQIISKGYSLAEIARQMNYSYIHFLNLMNEKHPITPRTRQALDALIQSLEPKTVREEVL